MRVPRGSADLQAPVKYGDKRCLPRAISWRPSWVASPPRARPVAAGRLGDAPGRGPVSGGLFLGLARGRQQPDGVPVVHHRPRPAVGVDREGPQGTGSARRFGAAAADGGPLRLRDWRVRGAGADRTLEMDFASPLTGDLEVLLKLAAKAPLPPSFVLPLPSPQGRPIRDKGAYLAYRVQGLEVERVNPLGVTGIRPEEFALFWPASSDPNDVWSRPTRTRWPTPRRSCAKTTTIRRSSA